MVFDVSKKTIRKHKEAPFGFYNAYTNNQTVLERPGSVLAIVHDEYSVHKRFVRIEWRKNKMEILVDNFEPV